MSLARLTQILEQHEPVKVSPVAQLSTNSYADVAGSLVKTDAKKFISYTFSTITNNTLYKILASNDNVTFVEVQGETSLVVGTAQGVAIDKALYDYYKIQIKSAVAETHGSVTIRGCAK